MSDDEPVYCGAAAAMAFIFASGVAAAVGAGVVIWVTGRR